MQTPVVVKVQVAHDSGVVDQNIECRKLRDDLSVQRGDGRRIADIAGKNMNVGQRALGRLEPPPIPSGDYDRVATLEQLFRHLEANAARSTGDQNRFCDCSGVEVRQQNIPTKHAHQTSPNIQTLLT
jgi:hypothetical protein